MDSIDLEREKGITILAKNTAVRWTRRAATRSRSTSSTPPATPTSAARSSARSPWSTASLLLVDASEGPLPQTRFVLRKALELEPAGHPGRQQGRPPRRPHRRGRRRGRGPVHRPRRRRCDQLDFPIVYCNGRDGRASMTQPTRPTTSQRISPRCSSCSSTTLPAPTHDPSIPLQAWVTNLDCEPVRRPSGDVPRPATARSARASRSSGAAPTAPSSGPRSPCST